VEAGEAGTEAELAAGIGSLPLNSDHPFRPAAACEGAIVEEVCDEDDGCSEAAAAAVVAEAEAGVAGVGEVEDSIVEVAVVEGADMVAGQPSAAEPELLVEYKVEDTRPQVGRDCTRVGAEVPE